MGKKKQQLNLESVQFKTAHNLHIPYAYVDPKTNFLGGKSWGEQEYLSDFLGGFSLGRQDASKEIDYIINQLQAKEKDFIKLLNEKNMIISNEGDWYEISMKKIKEEQQDTPPNEMINALKTELNSYININLPEEQIEQSLETSMNSHIIESAVKNLPKSLQIYFNTGLNDLPTWATPNELFNQISPLYKDMIAKHQEVPVPLLKLITNMIAWYELPENRKKQGTGRNSLYNRLKTYRTAINKTRKGKRSAIRKASADINTKSNKLNVEQMLGKMQQSIRGQTNQQLGDLIEKDLYKALIQNGFNKNQVHMTGKITLTIEEPNSNIELNLNELNTTDEFSSKELAATLSKGKNRLRSPKADLVIEDENKVYGISVKSTSLKSKNSIPHKIALHHGTYISLVRFLSRYKGGIGLANQLLEPGKMHAILNMVRASGETNSPSLDLSASSLSYAFLGANEGNIFTDYGQEVQEEYEKAQHSANNIMALVDSSGNMRLVSSLLKEVRDNLNKASVEISFKAGNFHFISKNGQLNSYTRDIIFPENFASPSDFSSIEALVYMYSS